MRSIRLSIFDNILFYIYTFLAQQFMLAGPYVKADGAGTAGKNQDGKDNIRKYQFD